LVRADDHGQLQHDRRDLLFSATGPGWRSKFYLLCLKRRNARAPGRNAGRIGRERGRAPSVARPPHGPNITTDRSYLVVCDSSVSLITRVTFNLSVWLFWIGTFYLLFFWRSTRKRPSLRPSGRLCLTSNSALLIKAQTSCRRDSSQNRGTRPGFRARRQSRSESYAQTLPTRSRLHPS